MDDLYVRLQKALDEAEERAKSFSTRSWRSVSGEYGPGLKTGHDDEETWSRECNPQVWRCDDEADGCPDIARQWLAEAEHIARWDPSTVLRLIERDRNLLEAYDDARAADAGNPLIDEVRLLALRRELDRAAEFWLTDTEER